MPLEEDNVEPLTPNHLLYGGKLRTNNVDLEPPNETKENEPVNRELHLEIMLDHFWKRWTREYLTAQNIKNTFPVKT